MRTRRHSLVKSRPQQQNRATYQPKKDFSTGLYFLMIMVFFAGTITLMAMYSFTLIDWYGLSKIIIGCAVIGFLIPLRYYRKWLGFIKYEVIIFNILGITPFLSALFILLNFLFTSEPTKELHFVEYIYRDNGIITTHLENNAYADEPKIVIVNDVPFSGKEQGLHFELTLAEGLFGFTVIKNRKFIIVR